MRIECWIPKTTNIHSEYVLFITLPRQQWLGERATMLIDGLLVVLLRLEVQYICGRCWTLRGELEFYKEFLFALSTKWLKDIHPYLASSDFFYYRAFKVQDC